MPKYSIEMRRVEIHDYEVEADSKEEAIDMIYDLDLEPKFIEPICYEVDDIHEYQDEEMLTPAEYDKLRTENLDWLAGKEK